MTNYRLVLSSRIPLTKLQRRRRKSDFAFWPSSSKLATSSKISHKLMASSTTCVEATACFYEYILTYYQHIVADLLARPTSPCPTRYLPIHSSTQQMMNSPGSILTITLSPEPTSSILRENRYAPCDRYHRGKPLTNTRLPIRIISRAFSYKWRRFCIINKEYCGQGVLAASLLWVSPTVIQRSSAAALPPPPPAHISLLMQCLSFGVLLHYSDTSTELDDL